MRAVIVSLEQGVTDFDEGLGPEIAPPLAMGGTEGFEAVQREGRDPFLGFHQRFRGLLVGDHGRDQYDGLGR